MRAIKLFFAFCIGASILVLFHEFGHLLIALALGIKAKSFSLGFGTPLISFLFQDISFEIAPIPLGGYVSFNPEDLTAQPLKWFLIGIAGVAFNVLQGLVFIYLVLNQLLKSMVITHQYNSGIYGHILQNFLFPKQVDFILSQTTYDLISKNGKLNLFKMINCYLKHTASSLELREVIKTAIITKEKEKGISSGFIGPIGIAKLLLNSYQQSKGSYLLFLAELSFNLAIFNLLPIMFLDGGKLVLSLIMVFSSYSYEEAYRISSIVCLVLMLVIFLKPHRGVIKWIKKL